MNLLHLSENLVRFRHDKKLTQEEIAQFLGVTKASVSKWENGQSMPDIQLLPQLAVFYNVSVDELLGYEAQLSKEQVQRIYLELSESFALNDFDETMEHSKILVHQYYSCYPFLLQICVLWLNHFMLAKSQEAQQEILAAIAKLCQHILDNSKSIELCNQAVSFKALVDLQSGKPMEVIENLEDLVVAKNLSGSDDTLLIQAYQMTGQMDKAKSNVQIALYMNLIGLVGMSVVQLGLYSDSPEVSEEIIKRMDGIIDSYGLMKLQPNAVAQLAYQAAVTYAMQGQKEKALERINEYGKAVSYLLDHLKLHGDSYFDALDSWFERLELGTLPPRNRKLILEHAIETLNHPGFVALSDSTQLKRVREQFENIRKQYDKSQEKGEQS